MIYFNALLLMKDDAKYFSDISSYQYKENK